MKRVTGIGGIFFKAKEHKKLIEWYREHLGIETEEYGGFSFRWRDVDDPNRIGMTVWSPFRDDTTYLDPSRAPFMINYRVENLDALLDQLREEGVTIDEKREDTEYGRFAWIMDPEGNKIELWEPPPGG